jgi:hypothetical protein
VWVELERPDRRDKPRQQRLLICTDPALSAQLVISGYAKRWAVESLFRNLKHGFGLKDAWQQSRQALMRWVTVLAVGYAMGLPGDWGCGRRGGSFASDLGSEVSAWLGW